MKRHGRVRITFKGHAKDSWAELELPIEEVVGSMIDATIDGELSGGLPRSFLIEGALHGGDGVRVTLERVPAPKCLWCGQPDVGDFRICEKKDPKGPCGVYGVTLTIADVFRISGRGPAVTGRLPKSLPEHFAIHEGYLLRRVGGGSEHKIRGIENDLTSHPFAPGKAFTFVVNEGGQLSIGDEVELIGKPTKRGRQ